MNKKHMHEKSARWLSLLVLFVMDVWLFYSAVTGKYVSIAAAAAGIAASVLLCVLSKGKKAGMTSAGIAAEIFFAMTLPASAMKEPFYQLVYAAEAVLIQDPYASQFHPSGIISRGNLYPSDTVLAEATMDEMPQETIYLKNFTGGSYEDGNWISNDDQELEIMRKMSADVDETSLLMTNGDINNVYLIANLFSHDMGNPQDSLVHVLAIDENHLSLDTLPQPYYADTDIGYIAMNGKSPNSASYLFHFLYRSSITLHLSEEKIKHGRR